MVLATAGVGGAYHGQQQPQEEEKPLFPFGWPAYAAFSAVGCVVWTGVSALSCAWMRLVARPAPAGVAGSSLVLGSSVARIKENVPTLRQTGLLFLGEWGYALSEVVAAGIAVFVDSMRRDVDKTQQEEPANVTVLGRMWGYTIGYALTFPLGIIHTSLCLRPGTSPLVGLTPWSPLGRQHWVTLPAKIVERLLVTLCTDWVNEWCGKRLGLDLSQVLGWLLPDADEQLEAERDDIEEEGAQEEPSLSGQIAWGAKRWLVSRVPSLASGILSTVVSMPWGVVFVRMMAEPGRYRSVVACVRHIWTSEGLGGFFRELPLALAGPICFSLVA